jgi:hypothetical protein
MARLSPSLLVLPAAAGVYVTTYWVVGSLRHSPAVEPNYVAAAIVTWIFTLLSRPWFLRRSLSWTPTRGRQTTLAALLTGGVAVASALLGLRADRDLGLLLGSIGPPLVWVVATAWIWRETDEEHRRRIAAAGGPTVVCPSCGYDLRGLKATRCPECGTECTLDELFAAQGHALPRADPAPLPTATLPTATAPAPQPSPSSVPPPAPV